MSSIKIQSEARVYVMHHTDTPYSYIGYHNSRIYIYEYIYMEVVDVVRYISRPFRHIRLIRCAVGSDTIHPTFDKELLNMHIYE